jgi:methylmalonyl-CoA/ethylmalonyl-CoA epimerase
VITHLDHIAIAVPDLSEAIERFAKDFGLSLSGTEDVPTEQTSTAFFPIPGTRIELVAPMAGEGPIATSLSKRGPGMHHLCFRTDDIEADMAHLTAKGYRFIQDTPKPGAHGSRVAFIHPKSTGGVLIELAEPGPKS